MLTQYQQAVEQHRQRVYSFAYYSLRAAADAEDVTQEVFIRMWQHWKKIDHDRLGAWLMRVTHNSVIDHVRKANSGQKRIDQFADVEAQHAQGQEQQSIENDRFKEKLASAIKALDEPYRSIVIMRDIQGATYNDIQHSLDLTQSQVKVYLHRGRSRLRQNPALREIAREQLADNSAANSELTDSTLDLSKPNQSATNTKSGEGLDHAKH